MNIEEISQKIADIIEEQTAEQEQLTLAVSGGSTPDTLFSLLATRSIDWKKVHIFWVDERFVPADSEFSNYGKAHKIWLSKTDIPSENIHRIKTEKASASEASLDYEKELSGFFKTPLPCFDIILLGMGDDGHTASLFPGSAALEEKKRAVINVPPPTTAKPAVERITLTFPAINNARQKIFLISGGNKKAIATDITCSRIKNPASCPACGVKNAIWFTTD